MPGGLTNKQRAFMEHYLTCWNATEAARLAGYRTPRQEGSRLLSNAVIAAAIEARLAELKMSADEVLVRLTEHARSSMADFLDVDRQSIDLAKAETAGKLHLVKKFTRTENKYGTNLSLELHDAQAALQLLGKHHGLFKDVYEFRFNPADLTDEQLARIAAGEDPAKVLSDA